MERLVMNPATGGQLLRFVGDRLKFDLRFEDGRPLPPGWRAFLRTNLGRAAVLRHQIIHAHTGKLKLVDASWRDVPMQSRADGWSLDLPMTEAGYFRAKAYAVDPRGWQHWPEGSDFGVSVHPDSVRTANTIYCAFVRMFGESRALASTHNEEREKQMAVLDKRGFTVIPPSGKLRDLVKQLPHIVDTLGCRVLHLLPVHPTPTVYARFGRFGSPYAAQDLTAIDPALVEFDKRTTGVDQFRELTYAAHLKNARVFLDIVINHTGWGARLQETHPEWFVRHDNGDFASPGAWGTAWEDLVELDQRHPALWENIADTLLTWCRRGVDGFRCDAGYKIPVPAWQYITARVLDEFPETIFLLEGLGGSWESTEALLTEGGMQWAYSELFQNYSGKEVAWYLDYAHKQCERVGVYVHYSETHDNNRLAAHEQGRAWSLLRNRLCALTSANGGFGFTCGVEWLATEKLQVHQNRGLNWGGKDHVITELADLNRLLADHPCFFDGAVLRRLSGPESPVLALSRVSAEGLDRVLVLANTDAVVEHSIELDEAVLRELGECAFDLLTRKPTKVVKSKAGRRIFKLAPGACLCLSSTLEPLGLSGDAYRRARAQAAWAVKVFGQFLPTENMGPCDWRELAKRVDADPRLVLVAIQNIDRVLVSNDPLAALEEAAKKTHFPAVVTWTLSDARRITPIPPGHSLFIQDSVPFRATLTLNGCQRHVQSVSYRDGYFACLSAGSYTGDGELAIERYAADQSEVTGRLRYLKGEPDLNQLTIQRDFQTEAPLVARDPGVVLLTNGIGGMARMQVNLGAVKSKYDCVLGANLHPAVPVDRHIFVKRVRAWVVADGFICPLNGESLVRFSPGPPADWIFVAGAGDGRAVEVHLTADMLPDSNTTVLRVQRPPVAPRFGQDLPDDRRVSISLRIDILDRGFHFDTHRNAAAEQHFSSNSRPLSDHTGFEFTPTADRQLRVMCDGGKYHHEAEWCMGLHHPVEASRGQIADEDCYSPGWFELPLPKGDALTLTLCAEKVPPPHETFASFRDARVAVHDRALARANLGSDDQFGRQLALASQAFVVRRHGGRTVIAGYPWFLDWGRDSLICARGLLAAGMAEEVRELIQVFGRFEEHGTLPNTIHGEDASNRDTSDAPLWFGVVCEEYTHLYSAKPDLNFYATRVDAAGRTVADVLRSIAVGYMRGTPNGIRMDPRSGLVFSPTHFTWMDTNHPAGTPREGFPICIQVLWIQFLRQLERLDLPAEQEPWGELAARAELSLRELFWLDDRGWLADVLHAKPGQPAASAVADTALRSNCLLAVSFGILAGEHAQRCVEAARHHLLVPGALRSLAPLPVTPPLAIYRNDGRLLNDPINPYWGSYEGDEDTHRKPAYHNGTAWVWTLPSFCEALVRAWNNELSAICAARAYLGSMDRLLTEGCLGQLPEILDGDVPHNQRGCDAQAWSLTETLRVWKLLRNLNDDSV